MNKALFLDRDGVIDELVFHEDSGGFEAPRNAGEVRLRPGVREALQRAADDGWLIVVISNQPDAAKGKTTRDALDEAHRHLVELLQAPIAGFYYCFHRAEDRCECRKPGTKHVLDAARTFDIDLRRSWFVGDVDTDIECGRRAGMRTALIEYEHSAEKRGNQRADLICRDLDHVVRAVTAAKSDHGPQSED
jgi:D-glycero-D-manno-heptose 1,7-bisphosphate phosphatase